jgi:hypothetical protein
MDVTYLVLFAALWLTVAGLARGCAALQRTVGGHS